MTIIQVIVLDMGGVLESTPDSGMFKKRGGRVEHAGKYDRSDTDCRTGYQGDARWQAGALATSPQTDIQSQLYAGARSIASRGMGRAYLKRPELKSALNSWLVSSGASYNRAKD